MSIRSGRSVWLKVLAVVFAVLLLQPMTGYASRTLHLSISEYRPWVYKEDNKKQGIAYDIIMAAGESMGVEIKAALMPYKRTFAALASGQSDMNIIIYSNYSRSADYPHQLHVAEESLFELKVVGASLKRRKLKIGRYADLRSFRLGGRRSARSVYRGFAPSQFSVMEYVNHEALLKGVLSERIDIAILSMESFGVVSKSLGVDKLLEVSYRFPVTVKLGIGWSKPALGAHAQELSSEFCKTLRHMKRSGEVATIISRYSNTDYFDGFGQSVISR